MQSLLLLLALLAPLLQHVHAAAQVATPVIHPEETTHVSLVNIFIHCDTPGAVIRYTVDGSTPGATSALLQIDTSVVIDTPGTTTVKAVATKQGMEPSAEAEKEYEVRTRCASPQLTPAGGTFSGSVSVSASSTTPDAQVCYTTDGSTPHSTSTGSTQCVPSGAPWILTHKPTSSSDGTVVKAVAVRTSGYYAKSLVVSEHFNVQAQVAAPLVLPAADLYVLSAPLSVSSSTQGASVHYTLDGSLPTRNSLSVTHGGVLISSTGVYTLRVRAFREDMQDSDITLRNITVQARMARPSVELLATSIPLSPGQGQGQGPTYVGDVVVQLTCNSEGGADEQMQGRASGGRVHYSLDPHITPTDSSPSVACGSNFTLTAPAAV